MQTNWLRRGIGFGLALALAALGSAPVPRQAVAAGPTRADGPDSPIAVNAVASSWPMFQHDRRHTGRSDFVGIQTWARLSWTTQLPGFCGDSGTGLSQSLSGLVLVSACGNLSALDPDTGEVRWTFTGGETSRSVPAVDSRGDLYWGYGTNLVSLTADGTLRWAGIVDANHVFGSSPVLDDQDHVIFTHDAVLAVSSDGQFFWGAPAYTWLNTSPAIGADGTIFVSSPDGLWAYSPDGRLIWHDNFAKTPSGYGVSIGDDGTVYAGATGAELYAVTAQGQLTWSLTTEESRIIGAGVVIGPPAIGRDGTLYFGTDVYGFAMPDVGVYAVHPNGTLKWRVSIKPRADQVIGIGAPPILDNQDDIFTCSLNGFCYGIEPAGHVIWQQVVNDITGIVAAPLLVQDGHLVVLDPHARVYSFVQAEHTVFLPLVAVHT